MLCAAAQKRDACENHGRSMCTRAICHRARTPAMTRVTLALRLRRINRVALGAAGGVLTLVIFTSSFALGLFTLIDPSRAQARVLADTAGTALVLADSQLANDLLQSLRHSPAVR